MFIKTSIGLVAFLFINISLLYASYLSIRRYFPHASYSARLVSIGIVFYALIIMIFQLLSPFNAITSGWIIIACIAVTVISHFLWSKHSCLYADYRIIKSWIKHGPIPRWALLISTFVLFVTLVLALLIPPYAWDSLIYHLTYAAFWIKKGTLAHFNALESLSITYSRYFPINGEIFAAWFLLPFHNDILVNLMNFPITLLGGISCYALTREMGFSQKDAIWAPALICFSPVIYFHLKSQYLTNALFAFSSASALFICRFLKSGLLSEGLMSLISAGILLGIQYNGVPTVLVVFIVFSMKVIRVVKYAPLFKRLILIFLGLSIILVFGGRQYIHNTIDAHNPFYPFSIKIFERELFEGWPRLREIDTRISTWEKEKGYDKFTWWEIEYRKFLYLPSTAGPQFFPFFILAVLSLFVRPRDVPKNLWYCLACMWILPLIVFYTNSSTSFTRRGPFIDGSVRFIVASFALFSIQALVLIHTWKHHFKPTEILLSAFMAWHILRIYERQVWEIEVTYPVLIVLLVGLIVFYEIGIRQVKRFETASTELPRLTKILNRRVLTMLFSSILLFVSFYFLQVYKDTTRYAFYREHFKNRLPGKFIDAWEFLDKPNEKKTIAMAMDFSSDNWFFYPLFGRQLQNDITYISSKHKWEVPTWFDSGIVSGNNFTIWWYNLEKNNVDYIFAAEPLPSNELKWINQQNKSFQLVFLDDHSKIFRFLKEEK